MVSSPATFYGQYSSHAVEASESTSELSSGMYSDETCTFVRRHRHTPFGTLSHCRDPAMQAKKISRWLYLEGVALEGNPGFAAHFLRIKFKMMSNVSNKIHNLCKPSNGSFFCGLAWKNQSTND